MHIKILDEFSVCNICEQLYWFCIREIELDYYSILLGDTYLQLTKGQQNLTITVYLKYWTIFKQYTFSYEWGCVKGTWHIITIFCDDPFMHHEYEPRIKRTTFWVVLVWQNLHLVNRN